MNVESVAIHDDWAKWSGGNSEFQIQKLIEIKWYRLNLPERAGYRSDVECVWAAGRLGGAAWDRSVAPGSGQEVDPFVAVGQKSSVTPRQPETILYWFVYVHAISFMPEKDRYWHTRLFGLSSKYLLAYNVYVTPQCLLSRKVHCSAPVFVFVFVLPS